jgi:hypothetical protein
MAASKDAAVYEKIDDFSPSSNSSWQTPASSDVVDYRDLVENGRREIYRLES